MIRPRFLVLTVCLLLSVAGVSTHVSATVPVAAAEPAPCENPGWRPPGLYLKDHTIFRYDGAYYLASIWIDPTQWEDREKRFAYARSTDLCNWEDLGPILAERHPGAWDEFRVWAPHVIEENGTYYLFYTGVTKDITQTIMVSISTNPADPASWSSPAYAFQPHHKGMRWEVGAWADARDPMVIKVGERYFMYYTGSDEGGGIVGVATANDLRGPWADMGSVLPDPDSVLESPGVFEYDGRYYLFYHRTSRPNRAVVRTGASPIGPWSAEIPILPGWAHEFWTTSEGDWMSSYLTSYDVSIAPVYWDTSVTPPQPRLSAGFSQVWIPIVHRAEVEQ